MTVLDNNDQMPTDMPRELSSKGYALSGKVMLSAIVVLFFVVLLMLCFHLYARWYLLRARRRHLRRTRRNRRTQLVFYVDNTAVNPNPASVARGLDAAVLKSLPVFLFSSETHADPLECAVCLSEFEENEPGRVLPKCNHSFHIECIDMWFHSHSTCPLCRSPVEPAPISPNPVDVAINIPEPTANDPESSSDLCMTCQHEEEQLDASTSSFGARRKPKPTGIQVPRRNLEGFDESTGYDSPSSQPARSPMSRILSFRRILSRDRRSSPSAASATAGSASAAGPGSELEMEQGKRETE